MGSIREMLNPQSVALIGATEKQGSIGRAVLTNLLRATERPLYPVNPHRRSVLGVPCFPSIGEAIVLLYHGGMLFVTPGCRLSLSLLVVASPCRFDRRAGNRENLMRDPAKQY